MVEIYRLWRASDEAGDLYRKHYEGLSRYEDRLRQLIESGELRIEPESRRNEVLGFIRTGLQDFSISRSTGRAHGWGIEVPGDPGQVIYVWWDALGTDRVGSQLRSRGGRLDKPQPLFPRIEARQTGTATAWAARSGPRIGGRPWFW